MEMSQTRANIVNMVIGWAASCMQDLETASGAARQSYHGLQHAGSHVYRVARRAAKIIMKDTPQQIWDPILRIMAMSHDLKQKFHAEGKAHAKFPLVTIRNRDRGPNEIETADAVIAYIKEVDPDGMITEQERRIIHQGIVFTIPEWHVEAATMYQPRMFNALDAHEAAPLACCLGLGDLGLPGAFTGEFLDASDDLIREECQGLNGLLLTIQSIRDIPENVREAHLDFFRDWDKSQASFARGQKALTFQKILDSFPEEAGELREAFKYFDESALQAGERAKAREHLTFEQYARTLGFVLPL